MSVGMRGDALPYESGELPHPAREVVSAEDGVHEGTVGGEGEACHAADPATKSGATRCRTGGALTDTGNAGDRRIVARVFRVEARRLEVVQGIPPAMSSWNKTIPGDSGTGLQCTWTSITAT